MNSSGERRMNSGVNAATSVSATPASARSSSRRSRVVMRSTLLPSTIRGCGSSVMTVGSSPESIAAPSTERCPRCTPSNVPIATARGRRSSCDGACAILIGSPRSRGSASSSATIRSSSASSTRNGPTSVRRSAAQWPPRASAIERTYVPDPTRTSRRATPSSYSTSSSSCTRITRIGISTATPRRWRRYARSPSIFTADAAGIGSSTSPRTPSSARSSSLHDGGSCSSSTSPSGSPVVVVRPRSTSVT